MYRPPRNLPDNSRLGDSRGAHSLDQLRRFRRRHGDEGVPRGLGIEEDVPDPVRAGGAALDHGMAVFPVPVQTGGQDAVLDEGLDAGEKGNGGRVDHDAAAAFFDHFAGMA